MSHQRKKNNKNLIQEIGFNGKLPVYQVCVKLLEAKKPKPIETSAEIADLVSPSGFQQKQISNPKRNTKNAKSEIQTSTKEELTTDEHTKYQEKENEGDTDKRQTTH